MPKSWRGTVAIESAWALAIPQILTSASADIDDHKPLITVVDGALLCFSVVHLEICAVLLVKSLVEGLLDKWFDL